MVDQLRGPDDRSRSSNSGSIRVNWFQRYIACALVIALAAIAAPIFTLRYQFNRDRTAVANLGPTCHFAHADEPVFTSLGPHVIGYYIWTGPAFLELPMRRYRIPWFNRVTRIEILNDSRVSEASLKALSKLPRLSQVSVYGATVPQKTYDDVVRGATGRVTLVFWN